MSDTHLQIALAHELEIIWLEDIAEMDYVCQGAYLLRGWSAAPPRVSGERRMVGYATVGREARRVGGHCLRRVFWLKTYDRALAPDGPYISGVPAEAVEPRTVRPGVLGELTERAYDGRRR
ncbi:MAG: DUF6009 family protein [Candidatus Tectomicrobia bacterium]|nr:DUF6009 family protein [Candidatus Tectomicrobia bacterium]